MLNTLKPKFANKNIKRLGRGDASGHGGTSTQGHKGQKARAGGFHKRGFEGGQMPLSRRLPKRGFFSFTRVETPIVNVGQLNTLPKGTIVNLASCKVLGHGELSVSLTIQAQAFSASAKEKIEKAGGRFEVVRG